MIFFQKKAFFVAYFTQQNEIDVELKLSIGLAYCTQVGAYKFLYSKDQDSLRIEHAQNTNPDIRLYDQNSC